MLSGRFIVIDGTDGSGKETQTRLLIERLRKEGYPVETVSFPQYGRKSAGPTEEYLEGLYGTAKEVGPRIASHFYAVDRYAASFGIRRWLDAGVNVVADRWTSSNMGHQGGKLADAEERHAFYRWNDDLEYGTFKLPRPDASIVLHVPAEIGQQLAQKRDAVQDIHQSDLSHLKAAETAYLDMVKTFPERFKLIECTRDGKLMSREEIHELVWAAVKPLLPERPAPAA